VINEPERRAASTTTTPTASPEIRRLRRGKSRARGSQPRDQGAVGRDGVGEIGMFVRVDMIVPAGEHRDRSGREAPAVGGRVNAAREAGRDREACRAEIARQPFGEADARRRCIARADDGDHRQAEDGGIAADGQERRGVVDHLQPARIIRLAQRHQGHAERFCRAEFALGILPGTDARRSAGAAAPRQVGERRQCPAGAAVMVDQGAKGPRPHIVAADEPKPVQPLVVAEADCRGSFLHGSGPRLRGAS
jgi:hypothetical protein